jgi:hypothetical protein
MALATAALAVTESPGGSLARSTVPPATIRHEGSKLVVTLVPALRQATRRHFPGYDLPPLTALEPGQRKLLLMSKPPPGEPTVSILCVGDFDGNGLPDVALLLKNRQNRWLLVAFHQTYRGEFRPYRLARVQPFDTGLLACWITPHPPGKVRSYMTQDEADAKAAAQSQHDWIEEEDDGATYNYGYYFVGGRYRSANLG